VRGKGEWGLKKNSWSGKRGKVLWENEGKERRAAVLYPGKREDEDFWTKWSELLERKKKWGFVPESEEPNEIFKQKRGPTQKKKARSRGERRNWARNRNCSLQRKNGRGEWGGRSQGGEWEKKGKKKRRSVPHFLLKKKKKRGFFQPEKKREGESCERGGHHEYAKPSEGNKTQ